MNESEFIYGKNFSKYKKLILGTKKTWKFLPSFLIFLYFYFLIVFIIFDITNKSKRKSIIKNPTYK